jgi:hypothetical protein
MRVTVTTITGAKGRGDDGSEVGATADFRLAHPTSLARAADAPISPTEITKAAAASPTPTAAIIADQGSITEDEPRAEQGADDRSREDDAERCACDHSWHARELRVKLLDLRPHDGDVSAKLAVRVKQR